MASASTPGSGIEHHFWRLRVTASSESGWESYIRGLQFTSTVTSTLPPIKCCWSSEIDRTDRGAIMAFEVSTRATGGYRTTQAPGLVGDYIAVEYEDKIRIDGVAFMHHGGHGNSVKGIALEWSDDGESWSPIFFADVTAPSFDSTSDGVLPASPVPSSSASHASHIMSADPSPYALALSRTRRAEERTTAVERGFKSLTSAASQYCRNSAPSLVGRHLADLTADALSSISCTAAPRELQSGVSLLPPPPWADRGLCGAVWQGRGIMLERRALGGYDANICCPGPVTVFASPRVALVVSDATRVR